MKAHFIDLLHTRDSSLLCLPLANFLPKTFDMMKSYLPGASGFRGELPRSFKDAYVWKQASEAGKAQ